MNPYGSNNLKKIGKKMIEQYGLEDNEWLCALYKNRHHWAPIFVKDIFWAGMSTTQRSESMNAFFDGYVHPKTSRKQFISKYDVALQSKFEKEAKADFESFHKFPKLISEHTIEEQLSKIYTIGIFKKFQEELKALVSCTLSFVHIDGDISKFQFKERVKQKDGTMMNKIFEVHYKGGELDVWCIYRLFQFRGIMCRHALTVLNYKDVNEIPSRYILNRWRKDFKRLYYLVYSTSNVMPTGPAQRYNSIQKSCSIFTEIGALSEEKFHHVMKILNEARNQAMYDSTLSQSTKAKEIEIGNPVHVKSKGRPIEKMKISTIDQKIKKKKGSFYRPIFSSHHEMPRPYPTVFQEHVYPTQYIFHINSQEQAIPPNLFASPQAALRSPENVDAPAGKSMFSDYSVALHDPNSVKTTNFRLNIPAKNAPSTGSIKRLCHYDQQ
ncbi:protein FAR1-RELATED SEQUENCE 6-like [Asparagus officinalis]|uniref:protein FAR1-RELATED SEQUENCE 6-like n=1 Tax=Asparagus officinalis TaxID=4686 RepID=UPI00098E73ED|nr:protein FAR1-RELATED SEQUENCE 6-like [Asparagus officinalis]